MYKIHQEYNNVNHIKKFKNRAEKEIYVKNQLNYQLNNYYEKNYQKNYNNDLQYKQQQSLIDDISKMHLLPPKCPVTPQTYSDFFNDTSKLKGNSPYKLLNEIHPRDGKIHNKIEYNNFYSDWKKDASDYTDKSYLEKYLDYNIKNMDVNTLYNSKFTKESNESNITNNVKLYEETKNHKGFAIPMKNNGSNKVSTLYNNCLNKPTFEYKRFANNILENTQNSQNIKNSQNKIHKNASYWIDNPLFNTDITKETNLLYSEYMDSRVNNASKIYDTVFEDMYILGYNPNE